MAKPSQAFKHPDGIEVHFYGCLKSMKFGALKDLLFLMNE